MIRIATLLCTIALALSIGCASSGSGSGGGGGNDGDLATMVPHTGDDCVCGTSDGDLYGCYCEHCLLHGGNPANPDCVCLPIEPRADVDRTSVSIGGDPDAGGLTGFTQIVLRRGGKVSGRVVSDDGEKIVFIQDTGEQNTYEYDDLNTRSIYKLLLAKTRKDDGMSELMLATYARDIGLYAHSRRHFGYAVAADSALEADVADGIAQLDEVASASELDKARAALAAGKEREAEKHVSTILTEFPEEAAASEASMLLKGLDERRQVAEAAAAAEERAEEVADAVAPVEKRLAKVREGNHKGLADSKTPGRAISAFKSAVSEGERGQRDIERARKGAKGDSGVLGALSQVEAQLTEVMVDVWLNLASVYMVRTDYNSALEATNEAIALEPDSQEAKQMRARVETEANDWWGDDDDRWIGASVLRYGYRPGTPRVGTRGSGVRVGYGGRGGGMMLRR